MNKGNSIKGNSQKKKRLQIIQPEEEDAALFAMAGCAGAFEAAVVVAAAGTK
jgi:hypothetical protein